MSEQSQQQPERGEAHEPTAMSPLDAAFLATSRLRMAGEDTQAIAADATAENFGHADLAELVQQVTQQLGTVTNEIADRMEQDLHTFATKQQDNGEPPHDG